MTPSRITLTNVKTFPGMSQETLAYRAVLNLDGKPVYAAENQGHGGADFFHRHPKATKEQEDALDAIAQEWVNGPDAPAFLAELDAQFGKKERSVQQGLELLTGALLEEVEHERRLKRLCKANVVFVWKGETYSIKGAYTPGRGAAVKEKYEGAEIVNERYA
jgi:hypothetical protein